MAGSNFKFRSRRNRRRFQQGGHTHEIRGHQGQEICVAPSQPCPDGSYWGGTCCLSGDIYGVTSPAGRHYHNALPISPVRRQRGGGIKRRGRR